MRTPQVTCNCSVYGFPHRLGGGRCTGAEWAESVYLYERHNCEHCTCNVHGGCEVALGAESIEHCDTYQEHLRMGSSELKHPTDLEALLTTGEPEDYINYIEALIA